jgi:hypothetical protein
MQDEPEGGARLQYKMSLQPTAVLLHSFRIQIQKGIVPHRLPLALRLILRLEKADVGQLSKNSTARFPRTPQIAQFFLQPRELMTLLAESQARTRE